MEEVQNRQERLQKYNGGGSVETGHFHFGENRTFLFWLDSLFLAIDIVYTIMISFPVIN